MNLSTYGTDKSNTEIAHALLASHIRRKSKQAKKKPKTNKTQNKTKKAHTKMKLQNVSVV